MNKTDIVLGIDIGGTNTAYGFINQTGKLFFENSIPTCANEKAEYLFNRLFSNVKKELTEEFNLVGIGIGAPNANYYHGTIENPPNLKWGFVNVIDIVKKYFDVPSAITNDANAAAIGEMQFGAAKGMKDFIVITLGTGLGSGIVANGKLIYGADGFAGEVGHTIYDVNGRVCGCGRKGCLETYASASGIRRTVMELLCDSTADSILRDISFNNMSAKMIADAALEGDPIALEAFEYTGKILGIKLADSVAHTSPEAIILFGGLALSGDLIFKPVKKHFEENLLSSFKNKIKILPSNLTNGNSAILGSAALIWNEL
ncbi:MAG TPA: ROK family protein [Ignavibacteriaceae bacterium]|nr:ROK family protein [Ignavibacteriaceae bacterium]